MYGAAGKQTELKNSGLNINGSLNSLALGAIYKERNRAALINLVLWTLAKQWSSHAFTMNTQTNFQMKDYP